jgi:hypothetical protein
MLERLSVATFALLCFCTGEVLLCQVSACAWVLMLEAGLLCCHPRSHFSVVPRSTLLLPLCVKIWQTSTLSV